MTLRARLLIVTGTLAVLSEVLALLGIGHGAHAVVMAYLRHGHASLGAALLATAVIHALVASRPHRNAALVLGLGLELGHVFLVGAPEVALTSFGGGFGLAAIAVAAVVDRPRLLELSLFPALVLGAALPLDLTILLHPHTLDARLLALDGRIFGGQPSFAIARMFADKDLFRLLGTVAYENLPFVLAGIVHVVERRRGRSTDLPCAIVIAGLGSLALHHAVPAAGPGSYWPVYPREVPSLVDVLSTRPRLGVPAFPLAVSLLTYWHARHLGPRWRALAALAVVVTLLLTLGLGEHFGIDAVITVPFALAVRTRRPAAVALVALWLLVVRLPLESALALRALVVISLAAAFAVDRRTRDREVEPPAPPSLAAPPIDARGRVIVVVFFASGFAGLLYEVVFAKALALVFGSTAVASMTVLATYMGGMALGSFVGGRLVVRSALRTYGLCELGIGVWCALSPVFVGVARTAYVAIAAGSDPGRPSLVALQVALGALVLLPPTMLMGMTMPILARHFEREDPTLGRSVALLYTANTAGAAAGALLAGYALLAALGVHGATIVGVVANVGVGLAALRLAAREVDPSADVAAPAGPRVPAAARIGWLGLATLGIGGLVTLGLEVTYNHLLAVVVGNSTYAFSSMLVSFLVGLAYGGGLGRRWLRAQLPVAVGIGVAQASLAAIVLLGIFAWNSVPEYFASYAAFVEARTFPITELVRFIVCACLLIPPACCIGMSYPIAIEAAVRGSKRDHDRALGNAAGTNTIGNITGALLTGFVLIPALGSLHTLHALAAVSGAIAVGAITLSAGERGRRALAGTVAVAVVLAALQPSRFDLDRLASGSNVYFRTQSRGHVVDSVESIEGGLTTVCRGEAADGEIVKTLLTNGKFQGSDSARGEMRAQYAITLAPLLHTTERTNALVIGFGTGASARAMAEAGFSSVDIAELSHDIVDMARRHFAKANGNVLDRPNVSVAYTDGRNYLLLRESRYDLIGVEISSIWFAGAASLYNVDFYELTKKRLTEHGVLQQWIQLHHMDVPVLVSMLASIRAVYPRVWVYVAGGQGVVVACATDCPVSEAAVTKLDEAPALTTGLQLLGGSARSLARSRVLSPEGIDRFLDAAGAPPSDRARLMRVVSTDDNSLLEYRTPRGNIESDADAHDANLAYLRSFER